MNISQVFGPVELNLQDKLISQSQNETLSLHAEN